MLIAKFVLHARLRNLTFVVQDIEIVSSTKDLNQRQRDELKEIAATCQSTLEQVEQKIGSYSELSESQNSKRKHAIRMWKRLKWEPNNIAALRGRVSSNIILLNAFYGKIAQIHIASLIHHQEGKDQENVLDWLSSTNYAARYSDYIERRQKDTGQWLLDNCKFQDWIQGSKQTLFCPGIPGAGKTILTSIVIEELQKLYEDESDTGIAYIFCNFHQQEEQTLNHLLGAILRQFAQGQGPLSMTIQSLYDQHKEKGTRPTIDELTKALNSLCTFGIFMKSFIVIDALDECRVSDGSRSRFLDILFLLQKQHNLNLFVTSRFIPEIVERFNGFPALEIRANKNDVLSHLRGKLSLLPNFVQRDFALQEEICTSIERSMNGM